MKRALVVDDEVIRDSGTKEKCLRRSKEKISKAMGKKSETGGFPKKKS